jgi:hypothetical protein
MRVLILFWLAIWLCSGARSGRWTVNSRARSQSWRKAFESAIGLMEPFIAQPSVPPGWIRDLVVFRHLYAEALLEAGHADEARAQWTIALALTEKQLAANNDSPLLLSDRAQLQGLLRKPVGR